MATSNKDSRYFKLKRNINYNLRKRSTIVVRFSLQDLYYHGIMEQDKEGK